MKQLLRNIIDFESSVTQENLILNLQRLISSKYEWNRGDDQRLFQFVVTYFQQRLEVPAAATITDYFERLRDTEVVERIKDLESVPVFYRSNFKHLLENALDEQHRIRAVALLKESQEIITKGLEIEGERKQGIRDGLQHFASKANDLILTDYNAQTFGDIRDDGQLVWNEYEEAKLNKDKVWGKFTGLQEIDKVCHGAKKGELWIHAAYPGELKTMFAMNWCYNLVTRYRSNVMYGSFEMPYRQLRRVAYTMHSANSRWRLDENGGHAAGLDYRKFRDGQLDPKEEAFLQDVIKDFQRNPDYGAFQVWSPDRDITIDDVRLEAELLHKRMEIGLIVLDHGQLIEARKKKRSKDYVVELNSIIRDAKKLALHFNQGEGIPVLMLFQINRQGKEEANKNEGRYKMNALTYANECLAEGTLVKTNTGLRPIETINVGDSVWSRSGWKTVRNVFDNGVQPVRRLLTEHGFMVDLTSSHRLRIIENGAVLWREVRDLKVGDCLLTDFGTRPFPEEEPVLPALDFHSHEKPSGMKAAPLTVPSALTVPLAYLMGAFVGDGTLKTAWKKYTSRKKGDVRKYLECNVGFTGNRLETTLKSKLSKLFRDVFGQGCTSLVSPSRAGSFNLSKSNNALYRWFNQVGCDRRDGLPPSILGATKHSAIAFLRGFWDTDGSINNQGLLSLGQKGANATTLRQTQLLMQDLGIATTLSFGHCRLQGKRHARWLLKVRTREGRRRFAEMIGFTEPEKQIKLMGLVNRSFDSKKAGDRTKWPVAELYRSLCERYYKRGLPRKVLVALRKVQRGLQYVSDGAVGELLVRLSDQTDDRDLEHLRALYQGTRPHRISSLDDVSIHVRVFDLEVTGDHEYATAGFLSHNCEKSADIITTTYLNDDHRRNGTTVFCNLKNRDNPIFEPFVASVNFTSRRISNMNTINSAGGRGMAVEDHQEALRMMMNV